MGFYNMDAMGSEMLENTCLADNVNMAFLISIAFIENIFRMLMLSKNLSYEEVVRSATAKRLGINNTPNARQISVLKSMAKGLFQPLRDYFGVPIFISSGFRCKELNEAISGSSKTSHHMILRDICAIDIDQDAISSPVSNADIFYYIKDNLDYHTLIWEHGDDKNPGWVHVSFSKDSKKNKRANTLRAVRKSLKTHYIPFKNENTA